MTSEHPRDLAAFRAGLLAGDRRLTARRRRRFAGGAAAVATAVVLIVLAAPFGAATLDAEAVAAQARRALDRAGILHSVTVVGDQRVERWSLGDRWHTITSRDGRPIAEQVHADGRSQVRFAPDWRLRDVPPGGDESPADPLQRYADLLARARPDTVSETEVDGVPALRLVLRGGEGGTLPQVAQLRRSDHLPIAVRLDGGAEIRFPVVEWLPSDDRTPLEFTPR